MKQYIFYFLGMIIFLGTSCDQVVKVDLPPHEEQLVIHSYMNPGDSMLSVIVSHTRGALDESEEKLIDNATVELFKDGAGKKTFSFVQALDGDSWGWGGFNEFRGALYQVPNEEAFWDLSSTYELRASADGFASVSSEQELFEPIELISSEYNPEGGISPDGYERLDEILIEFQDKSGEENHYEFRVIFESEYDDENYVWIETQDARVEPTMQTAVSKDNTYDGQTVTLQLMTYPYWDEVKKLIVEVSAINQDKYAFNKSFFNYYMAEDNPFAEPVTLFTNIENGRGIFSVENSRRFVVWEE